MNQSLIPILTALAGATADYESAWRKRYHQRPRFDNAEESRLEDVMRDTYRRQQGALVDLARELGGDLGQARAIHGALIVASGAIAGTRPDSAQVFKHDTDRERFIGQVVRGEAGV